MIYMGITLGIDIGGSTTKLIGLDTDGNRLGALQIRASSPTASAYGALGSFLTEHKVGLDSISRITLTGVGASFLHGNIYDIPTDTVHEFTAIGRGGLAQIGRAHV
jgi:type II pantothenate kinase